MRQRSSMLIQENVNSTPRRVGIFRARALECRLAAVRESAPGEFGVMLRGRAPSPRAKMKKLCQVTTLPRLELQFR